MATTDKIKKHGGNIRNARTTHPYRVGRRERAAQRLLASSERNVEDQLVLIAQRSGQSAKEVLRLTGDETADASEALRLLRAG